MDDFFTKTNCDRCGEKLSSRIQSWFTNDVICLSCHHEEEGIKRRATNSGLGDLEGCGYVPDIKKEVWNFRCDPPKKYK
jgi:hypothetical protein